MPIIEPVAEAIGSAFLEFLYWCSIRPHGACAISGSAMAIAYCVKFDGVGSWSLGIALTLAAAAIGYVVGSILTRLFRQNRPARVTTCVLATSVTFGSIAWLILSA